MAFDVTAARALVPALSAETGRIFLDGPAGTQSPAPVIEAIRATLAEGISNLGGSFPTSVRAAAIDRAARSAMSDLLGARRPEEIVFGQNMTSLTMAASRAISAGWAAGDEVVVTTLDHDANVSPWVMAARDRGANVKVAAAVPGAGTLTPDSVRSHLTGRTRLVAVTMASNALGTVVDVAGICRAAREAGALTYVDAVHYAPHGTIDVAEIGCDFLVVSAYKFFGPHVGVLYGNHDVLERIEPYRIGAAPDSPPYSWETGTQSFEALAGLGAAVDYLAGWGGGDTRREALVDAMGNVIVPYERELSRRFLSGLGELEGVESFGVPEPEGRVPTFAVDVAGRRPASVAARLARRGIFTWAGDFYATGVVDALGKRDTGGLLRIGFVHYNTVDEVDAVLDALGEISRGG